LYVIKENKKMIGIIGAMEEEVNAIKALMDLKKIDIIQGYQYMRGSIENKDVVLLQGGIGKVNATISTTLLFTHFDIDVVINVGSAGGLMEDQEVGDVVISKQVVHHDVDLTSFNRDIGELPDLPRYFEADKDLLEKVMNVLNQNHIQCHVGLIASGDQFICREDQVQIIKKHFPQAMCSEMEAASIAQVCYVFSKKFIITRSLSDVFCKGNSSIQFDEYLKKASQSSAKMCLELIKLL
jgi:5''-methylthioadenosine/S-adenosylhomocysteine nucleosidase